MRHETFSFVCMWMICFAQDYVKTCYGRRKQLLKEYELETMLMGEDDDMEKKAIEIGGTLEWSEKRSGSTARSKACMIIDE